MTCAGTGAILDDKWLTKPLRQPLSDQAREDVGRAGRGEWHDQTYRSRRIGLRPCNPRDGWQRGGAAGQMKEISAGKFHVALPEPFVLPSLPARFIYGESLRSARFWHTASHSTLPVGVCLLG